MKKWALDPKNPELVRFRGSNGHFITYNHYPPQQPSGSRSMSKVGTWFLMVHVTSLDRIWPKLNLPSGAYGEKCIFACFRGLLAIFLLERSILFFRQSVESDNKSFGHKKMGVTLQKMVI